MKILYIVLCFQIMHLHAMISLSPDQIRDIGNKIWKNECNGTTNGLTSWRSGEGFPSLGIGHFIWFPAGVKEPFQETFPSLIKFMQEHGAKVPAFIITSNYVCPWKTRSEFYDAFYSNQLDELRQFLLDTIELQVQFIMQRVERSLDGMINSCTLASEKEHSKDQYLLLTMTPQGWYAIIDYINFKGEGIKDTEAYQGKGWGLKQVLLSMKSTKPDQCIAEFVISAKKVLTERTEHAPTEKLAFEQQWLKGWFNRLDTYLS